MERATVAQLRAAKESVASSHGSSIAHDIAPNITINDDSVYNSKMGFNKNFDSQKYPINDIR